MSTRAGRLTFEVDADGAILERSIRQIGRRAGVAGGEQMGDGFQQGFGKRQNRITTQFDKFGQVIGSTFSQSFEDGAQRAGRAFDKVEKNFDDNSRLIKSHVGRTIALWTALILSIGDSTAALGSGVSAALTGIIGSIGTGLVGALGLAGAAIAGFAVQVTLAISALQRMKDVVPEMQGALDNLNSAWENAGNVVAEAWGPSVVRFLETITGLLNNPTLLSGMGASLAAITDAFTAVIQGPGFTLLLRALETTIPNALTSLGSGFAQIFGGLAAIFAAASPTLERFADRFEQWATTWNNTMTDLASNGELAAFFDRALESLDAVFDAVGALSGALATLLFKGAESGDRMLRKLESLANQWGDWMKTIEGQGVLDEWFKNGEKIFDGLILLAGRLGQSLGRLVTPESVNLLMQFMDNLGQSLPFFESLIKVVGEGLDPLGLVAQVFNDIGNALSPVIEALEPVLGVINSLAQFAIPNLAIAVGIISAILIPFQVAWEFLNVMFQKFQEWIAPVQQAILDVVEVFQQTVDMIMVSLVPAFESIGDAIISMLPSPQEFERFLREDLGPMIQDVGNWIVTNLVPAIQRFADWLTNVGIPAAQDFWNFLNTFILPALGFVFSGFSAAADSVGLLATAVRILVSQIRGPIDTAVALFERLFGAAEAASGAAYKTNGIRSTNGGESGSPRAFASGGILNGPRRILAGEAGPEAIVPLRRNLNQVDPAVRWLSAMAQGRAMASGGVVGASGRTTTVAPGAIVVYETTDGRRTANDVMTRLVEYAAG